MFVDSVTRTSRSDVETKCEVYRLVRFKFHNAQQRQQQHTAKRQPAGARSGTNKERKGASSYLWPEAGEAHGAPLAHVGSVALEDEARGAEAHTVVPTHKRRHKRRRRRNHRRRSKHRRKHTYKRRRRRNHRRKHRRNMCFCTYITWRR